MVFVRLFRALLVLVMLVGIGIGFCARGAEVEAFVTYDHTSALTRGVPFNDRPEHTQEFIGAGATITVGARRRFEIDVAQGWKSLDAGIKGPWSEGTTIQVRYYPGRK